MERNRPLGRCAAPTRADDRIAHAFQQADLPAELVGDLRALVEQVHTPLAVRSSSLLEDALLPSVRRRLRDEDDPEQPARRRRRASASWSRRSSSSTPRPSSRTRAELHRARPARPRDDEKMAVIIQEVVGRRHGDRFYPDVSGVARSYNFYPLGRTRGPRTAWSTSRSASARRSSTAGVAWTLLARLSRARTPPFGSRRATCSSRRRPSSGRSTWASRPPTTRSRETEYLVQARPRRRRGRRHAALRRLDLRSADSDRLVAGSRARRARASSTSRRCSSLERVPLNDLRPALLAALRGGGRRAPVEIEFAADARRRTPRPPARFGFLQVRPMVGLDARSSTSTSSDLTSPASSPPPTAVLGNGVVDGIRDVVYVKPDTLRRRATRRTIAAELAAHQPGARRRRPALPADRLRPLGQLRSVARHPGRLGPDLRRARHRRGDAAGDERRARARARTSSTTSRASASATSRCRTSADVRDRLGLARRAAAVDRETPHRAARRDSPAPLRGQGRRPAAAAA